MDAPQTCGSHRHPSWVRVAPGGTSCPAAGLAPEGRQLSASPLKLQGTSGGQGVMGGGVCCLPLRNKWQYTKWLKTTHVHDSPVSRGQESGCGSLGSSAQSKCRSGCVLIRMLDGRTCLRPYSNCWQSLFPGDHVTEARAVTSGPKDYLWLLEAAHGSHQAGFRAMAADLTRPASLSLHPGG